MGINLGSTAISDVKLGSGTVSKLYLGSTQVWTATPAIKALKFSSVGTQTLGVRTNYLGAISPNFEYSLDNGATWTNWTVSSPITFGNGTDLYLRGMNAYLSESSGDNGSTQFVFSTNENVSCTGNIMHLLDYTQDLTSFRPFQWILASLFKNCSKLVAAPSLPATGLQRGCYYNMFTGCSSLTSAPELPATTLAQDCYGYMFNYCSSLTSAPELPATTLAGDCYYCMFLGCSALTSAPSLPATALSGGCYAYMFRQCPLSSIPSLSHISSLGNYSLRGMFYDCQSVKMSESQTGEYQNEYTFGVTPDSGTAQLMFGGTGGTFAGTPTVQTLYTSNTIVSAS